MICKLSRDTMVLVGCVVLAHAQDHSPQTPGSLPTFGTTVISSSGFRGQIYFIRPGSMSLPRFKHEKPVGAIYTTSLNIPARDFKEGFPGITNRFEWFAIDYRGKFWINDAGPYGFGLTSDDGSKLYIDGRLVIDNDGIHPPSTCIGTVELSTGIHEIRVSYFQGPRYQVALVLGIQRPGLSWRIFDTNNFTPPANSPVWISNDSDRTAKQIGKIKVGHCST